MSGGAVVVWFRLDLRLDDNPALRAAVARGGPVVPVFVWAPDEEAPWPPGAASGWWLHQSLTRLDASLRRLGSRLVIRRGPTVAELERLAAETKAATVFWNRRPEPAVAARDDRVTTALRMTGVGVETFNGCLLYDPAEVRTQQGRPFQMFTPFYKACHALPPPDAPLPAPARLPPPHQWPASVDLSELHLEPRIDWAADMRRHWSPGENGGRTRLGRFVTDALADYADGRDRPDHDGNSSLSPHLHYGEISPRAVWHAVRGRSGADSFLRELCWREFAQHLLVHFPHNPDKPLRPDFARFPWRDDPAALRAWQRGRTGYPLVDAGMRQLWALGWMHNRVRMATASFLVKHLLLPWQEGARWFWETLVDADLGNNTFNWQWTAGCGADAAPYFRIFNPVRQGERFDPDGDYVRRWVPELTRLSAKWIHRPWAAPAAALADAGVRLGHNYPAPVVDHEEGRRRALDALRSLRRGTKS